MFERVSSTRVASPGRTVLHGGRICHGWQLRESKEDKDQRRRNPSTWCSSTSKREIGAVGIAGQPRWDKPEKRSVALNDSDSGGHAT